MKTIIKILAVVVLIFLTILTTHFIDKNRYEHEVSLHGIIKYQKNDITLSVQPPEGYYIDCEVFGSVHIENKNIKNYNGKKITATCIIKNIKGESDYQIYPLLVAKDIKKID